VRRLALQSAAGPDNRSVGRRRCWRSDARRHRLIIRPARTNLLVGRAYSAYRRVRVHEVTANSLAQLVRYAAFLARLAFFFAGAVFRTPVFPVGPAFFAGAAFFFAGIFLGDPAFLAADAFFFAGLATRLALAIGFSLTD